MRLVITFLLALNILVSTEISTADEYLLLPQPELISYGKSFTALPLEQTKLTVIIENKPSGNSQGYRLEIASDDVRIIAGGKAGLYYAKQTLKQISKQAGNNPVRLLKIEDEPDFPVRGIMLDISRDKVPTMETLFNLVDMLASWKINHLQLYTEHTFAYKNHKVVWENASPMTADQIRILDKYCKERFVELVPNQNSFGHMERWLKHEKYRHLAEAPDYVDTEWGKRKWNSLYPAEPGAIALISELYDELIPNFSSQYINIGCDETFELVNGRSKELCKQIGADRVFIDFLLKINTLVEKHGKTMMFWSDMIQHNPEMMKELPSDVVALIWGYEADYPFDEHCRKLASVGCQYYVCPGTSTWLSLAGRTDNAKANLLNAAKNGLKHGSKGFINTDWGDKGDWEAITSSYPAYAYGAAVSWSIQSNKDMDLPAVLDEFAFEDEAKITGKLICELGNAYKVGGVLVSNSSVTARLLLYPDWDLSKAPEISIEKLQQMKDYASRVVADIDKAKMNKPDAEYVAAETRHAANLIRHGCELGIARLNAPKDKTENIPVEIRLQLAADLKMIMEDHKKVWLNRNREGGLTDSLAYMQELLKLYE